MNELDLKTVSKRASRGFLSLTFRKAVLLLISYLTNNLILARILPVETIGVFNIGLAIVTFFSYFSDVGLAAAIIQKKEKITEIELKTTFTLQLILVFLISLIIFFSAPLFANVYSLDESGVWLIKALAVSFFITSFKVIPSVLLERELRFGPLVTVEIFETLIFNVGLIVLAKMGFGINAFTFAVLARSFTGVAVIYMIAPWHIGIKFSKDAAQLLLGFGIPFQINSFLALVKDRLVPLVVAGIIGPVGIGFVTWAQNLAFLPLEVMNIVIRVSFPAFSRLQSDKKALKIALEKSLFLTTLFLYPLLFGLLAIAPSLIDHVVKSKWEPALPAFYLYSVSTFWAALSTTFTNTLNAIGKINTTLKLMLFWTILTWILTIPLTLYFGFLGVAISSAIISFTSVITIVLIKRDISVEIIKNIWQPLIASATMFIIVYILSPFFVRDILTLILSIILGVLVYGMVIFFLAKERLKNVVYDFKYAFEKN